MVMRWVKLGQVFFLALPYIHDILIPTDGMKVEAHVWDLVANHLFILLMGLPPIIELLRFSDQPTVY
jgi:hypothetical protein